MSESKWLINMQNNTLISNQRYVSKEKLFYLSNGPKIYWDTLEITFSAGRNQSTQLYTFVGAEAERACHQTSEILKITKETEMLNCNTAHSYPRMLYSHLWWLWKMALVHNIRDVINTSACKPEYIKLCQLRSYGSLALDFLIAEKQ